MLTIVFKHLLGFTTEMMDKKNITHCLYAGIYPENEGMCYNT